MNLYYLILNFSFHVVYFYLQLFVLIFSFLLLDIKKCCYYYKVFIFGFIGLQKRHFCAIISWIFVLYQALKIFKTLFSDFWFLNFRMLEIDYKEVLLVNVFSIYYLLYLHYYHYIYYRLLLLVIISIIWIKYILHIYFISNIQ